MLGRRRARGRSEFVLAVLLMSWDEGTAEPANLFLDVDNVVGFFVVEA